jgi:hypothetical protein
MATGGGVSPEEKLLAAIRNEQRRVASVSGPIPIDLHRLVTAAAEKRNLTRTAYVALAVTSFVAFDLELDRDEMLEETPIFARPFGTAFNSRDRGDKNGEGHGPWVIESAR